MLWATFLASLLGCSPPHYYCLQSKQTSQSQKASHQQDPNIHSPFLNTRFGEQFCILCHSLRDQSCSTCHATSFCRFLAFITLLGDVSQATLFLFFLSFSLTRCVCVSPCVHVFVRERDRETCVTKGAHRGSMPVKTWATELLNTINFRILFFSQMRHVDIFSHKFDCAKIPKPVCQILRKTLSPFKKCLFSLIHHLGKKGPG